MFRIHYPPEFDYLPDDFAFALPHYLERPTPGYLKENCANVAASSVAARMINCRELPKLNTNFQIDGNKKIP